MWQFIVINVVDKTLLSEMRQNGHSVVRKYICSKVYVIACLVHS